MVNKTEEKELIQRNNNNENNIDNNGNRLDNNRLTAISKNRTIVCVFASFHIYNRTIKTINKLHLKKESDKKYILFCKTRKIREQLCWKNNEVYSNLFRKWCHAIAVELSWTGNLNDSKKRSVATTSWNSRIKYAFFTVKCDFSIKMMKKSFYDCLMWIDCLLEFVPCLLLNWFFSFVCSIHICFFLDTQYSLFIQCWA